MAVAVNVAVGFPANIVTCDKDNVKSADEAEPNLVISTMTFCVVGKLKETLNIAVLEPFSKIAALSTEIASSVVSSSVMVVVAWFVAPTVIADVVEIMAIIVSLPSEVES